MAGNRTKVSLNSNGQYQTTVPKSIAQFFELEGAELEWKHGSARNKMEVIVHYPESDNDE